MASPMLQFRRLKTTINVTTQLHNILMFPEKKSHSNHRWIPTPIRPNNFYVSFFVLQYNTENTISLISHKCFISQHKFSIYHQDSVSSLDFNILLYIVKYKW